MGGEGPSGAFRDLRTLFRGGIQGDLTDRQLLERFANRADPASEDAFAIVLERHGPMVWGVCQRLLPDRHAADDAFQATFLVLARRAPKSLVDDSLGPWLHGVSRRVVARARAVSSRRRARETDGVELIAGPTSNPDLAEQLAILHQEIDRLTAHQRAAIILCDLEGLPHGEAAGRLGCPVGTVESRLSRGRERLRERLARRGLSSAACAEVAREAAVPPMLLHQAAGFLTNSPSPAAIPPTIAALAEGVTLMMSLARWKWPIVAATALFLTTAGVAVRGRQQPATGGTQAPSPTASRGLPAAARPDIEANRALAREQLALIDDALEMLHAMARNARINPADASFSLWENRRIEALRKSGAGKAEIVAALEKQIRGLEELEAIAVARKQAARGTEADTLDVRYRRKEAEIWLNEEKAR
ncbi:MAG: sigma-70 family RNA polymerase sigma factor [Isosphaeraceae bacterium]